MFKFIMASKLCNYMESYCLSKTCKYSSYTSRQSQAICCLSVGLQLPF